MPRGFTTQERERISRALLVTGRDLFVRQGLRKTALEELVAPARIVKSTFYQFFDSKEALYLRLMLDEAGQVKTQVIDKALLSTDDTREGLRRFLHATLDVLDSNPLWRRLVTHPEEMTAVAARLDPQRIAAMGDNNPSTALVAYVTDRQQRGDLVGDDPDAVDRGAAVGTAHALQRRSHRSRRRRHLPQDPGPSRRHRGDRADQRRRRPDMSTHRRRAVVIGAGIAGLSAALRLHRAGWEVLVAERTPTRSVERVRRGLRGRRDTTRPSGWASCPSSWSGTSRRTGWTTCGPTAAPGSPCPDPPSGR